MALAAPHVAPDALAEPVYLGAASRGSVDPEVARAFRGSLERSLARHGVPVLDSSGGTEDDAGRSLADARRKLDEATAAWSDGHAALVLEAVARGLEAFERGAAFTSAPEAWQVYRDLLSLRALVLLEEDKPREADDALRALLVVLPRYAPRRDRAPPALVRHVDDVKDELRSLPPAVLEVHSKPAGGIVVVDGKKRGRAPLIIEDVVPGHHYVAVEGPSGRYARRIQVGEDGARVTARLGGRKAAAARKVVEALGAPMSAPAFVEAVSDVDDDALVAVLLPAGKKVEILGARVRDGEVRVVCGVRAANNENDREKASYLLVEGLVERRADAWLDDAAEEGADPAELRPRFFSGTGTSVIDEDEPAPVSPAAVAVGVLGGIAAAAAIGTGVALYVSRELKKDEGFTWSVDTSGL